MQVGADYWSDLTRLRGATAAAAAEAQHRQYTSKASPVAFNQEDTTPFLAEYAAQVMRSTSDERHKKRYMEVD